VFNPLKRLAVGLLARRMAGALDRVATALDAQTALLERLTERFAPTFPVEPRGEARKALRADTGVDFHDPLDTELTEAFIARQERDTGHTPDEEELAIYLADEKTVDLHSRLAQRDQELARLMERRQ
jgi:hypothetical protein